MEKQVSVFVAELLYSHDCVIIPGFGGFVARHVPSFIHPGLHTVHPPSKSVLFNKNLVNNDGLLANSMIEKFNISYTEAVERISKFAEDCHRTLHQNLRLELENIGVLYLDTEKNIQFEPKEDLNFLIKSFGLSPVYAQPVLTEDTQTKKPEVNFADRKVVIEPVIKPSSRVRTRVLLYVGAPLALALLFLLGTNVAPKNSAFASLNPFGSKEQGRYSEGKFMMKKFKEKDAADTKIILNENGTGQLTLSGSMKNIVFVYVNETAEKDKTRVKKDLTNNFSWISKKQNVSGNYQVVIGCFMEKDNAERLVHNLHSRNINAGISGVNARGLYVVSTGGFDTRDSATVLLNNVRQSFPSAWVMRK
jgi:hypothetical protein